MAAIQRVEPFVALAEVYQDAGFADYSAELAPGVLNLAFDLDWSGRSLLDLGCGTGDLACWFAGRGFRVIAVDNTQAMLDRAALLAERQGVSITCFKADVRNFKLETPVELVTCVGGLLNYMPGMRDLEAVFRTVHNLLEPGKLFIFDLRTIQGLSVLGAGDRVLADNGTDYLILARGNFSFETLSVNRAYHVFVRSGQAWKRSEETHVLRGYPVQAVTRLLESCNLTLLRTMTPDFQTVESGTGNTDQLLFVAQRKA